MELRAYWDRTATEGGPTPELEDDSRTFHLQWAFEVGRPLSHSDKLRRFQY